MKIVSRVVLSAFVLGSHCMGVSYAHEGGHVENQHLPDDSVTGNGFWASRRGGGPADVLSDNVEFGVYRDASTSNLVPATSDRNGNPEYLIESDSEATVVSASLDFNRGVSLLDRDSLVSAQNYIQVVDFEDSEAGEAGVARIGSGNWTLKPNAGTSISSLDALIVGYPDSPSALAYTIDEQSTKRGKTLQLTAYIVDNDTTDDQKIVTSSPSRIENSTVFLDVSNGGKIIRSLRMLDDGRFAISADRKLGDGIYSATLNLTEPGDYTLAIRFRSAFDGKVFSRTATATTIVSNSRFSLTSSHIHASTNYVLGEVIEKGRFGLAVGVRTTRGSMPEYIDTRAEVWARNQNGRESVVGWIGGLVRAKSTNNRSDWLIPFTFHEGWLNKEHYQSQLYLKNLSITSISTGDELLFGADRVALEVDGIDPGTLSSKYETLEKSAVQIPSKEMIYGVHPSLLVNQPKIQSRHANHFSRDLLIIRGLNESAKPMGLFSSVIENRSIIDPRPQSINPNNKLCPTSQERAIDLMAYLNWLPARLRGAVAHSQGGLVGAELLENFPYVFYDNTSSTPPNVVSMGSPYNGTWMGDHSTSSVISSLLNTVFNAGIPNCSVPYELRRSQSPTWRARIGWRAKYQIAAFHTTHKKRKHCSAASTIIHGSDDGVINTNDAAHFSDGGWYDIHYSNYCHSNNLSHADQWNHPTFVNYVNQLFASSHENWQPF